MQTKSNNATKKEQGNVPTEAPSKAEGQNKSSVENASANVAGNAGNAGKRVATMSGVNNARVTANKQCSDVDARAFSYAKSSPATVNINTNNNPAKVDVYTFSNDPPPAVPAGAVKRKCPPGLPIDL